MKMQGKKLFGILAASLLLIGCGKTHQLLSPALQHQAREKGIKLDAMVTGAACRTYNVLVSEGRNVAAALVAL
mgnify:CR=1 FL=1